LPRARERSTSACLLAAELDGIAGDVPSPGSRLDPRPIIDELDALVSQVRAALDAITPSELLAELERPLESVRAIVGAFQPEARWVNR